MMMDYLSRIALRDARRTAVIEIASEVCGCDFADTINPGCRHHKTVEAREITSLILYRDLSVSCIRIAEILGGITHQGVLHAKKRATRKIRENNAGFIEHYKATQRGILDHPLFQDSTAEVA